MTVLCRDCGIFQQAEPVSAPSPKPRCEACASPRLVGHAELETLAIAHIDCDAFYATIEKRDNPSLAGQPVVVGGGRRGVALTACYVARQYGVRSAMPMFQVRKLCPHAVVVKPNMSKYSSEGRRVRALMLSTTPLVEPVSIDEAYLDLSGTERLHKAAPAQTLARLALRIEAEIGITVSVGLSFHRVLAKMASGMDKPRGFAAIGRSDALAILDPMPVGDLPGVGPQGDVAMKRFGIRTIGALRRASNRDRITPGADALLTGIETGASGRPVSPERAAKSISAETTFGIDLSGYDELAAKLWPLCERVSARLKNSKLAGNTVQLTVKTSRFKRIARRRTIAPPTQLASILFETASSMLKELEPGAQYRLIGVGASGLVPAENADRDNLLDRGRVRQAKLERAIDDVRARLGNDAIQKGRNFRRDED